MRFEELGNRNEEEGKLIDALLEEMEKTGLTVTPRAQELRKALGILEMCSDKPKDILKDEERRKTWDQEYTKRYRERRLRRKVYKQWGSELSSSCCQL